MRRECAESRQIYLKIERSRKAKVNAGMSI
jgi:hypothetical protein